MNVLEKILEEIEHEAMNNKEIGRKQCEGMARAMDIIRSHMDDCKTFEFDFAGVKSFDCPCGCHYVNTSSDGWIPVEERLPEGGDIIYPMQIVTLDNGDVCLGVYRHDDKEWLTRMSEGELYYTNSHIVVAWMPLPEPYKPKKTTAAGMEHIMSRFTKVE